MILKEDYLEHIKENFDPDEIVDLFALDSELLVDQLHKILWARRYKVAHVLEDEDLWVADGLEDEDTYAQQELGYIYERNDGLEDLNDL